MHFQIDRASLCFTLYLRAIFHVQAHGGLYLEGRFNGGFFALLDWGAYILRGLYMEGLIFGILRYLNKRNKSESQLAGNKPVGFLQECSRS